MKLDNKALQKDSRKNKKEEIDNSALHLFATKGFLATSIRDISLGAGVSEAALYRHYKSKEEMATTLFQEKLGSIKDKILNIMKEKNPINKNIKKSIFYLYSKYKENPDDIMFIILNFHILDNDKNNDKSGIYDVIINFSKNILSKKYKDENFTSTLIVGLVMQPIIFHHYKKLKKHPFEYVDRVSHECCKILGVKDDE